MENRSKKTYRIGVRLTEEERSYLLKEMGNESYRSLSNFIRDRIMMKKGKGIGRRGNAGLPSKEVIALYGRLSEQVRISRSIANNVNQAVTKINALPAYASNAAMARNVQILMTYVDEYKTQCNELCSIMERIKDMYK